MAEISRLFDWLGAARRENEALNTLADQLQLARGEAAKYRANAELWKATARAVQDELDAARPLIQAGMKRKEADKRGNDKKRRGR